MCPCLWECVDEALLALLWRGRRLSAGLETLLLPLPLPLVLALPFRDLLP